MVNAYVSSAWSKERLPVQNAEAYACGRGDCCAECYWRQVYEQRLRFNLDTLNSSIQLHYQAFAG